MNLGSSPPGAAIFSPSVARRAASSAEEWTYVDRWLAARFVGSSPPSFERNPETLRALLELAAFNETAEENRRLLRQVDDTALKHIIESGDDTPGEAAPAAHGPTNIANFKEDFFTSLEGSLTSEGKTALDVMASSATHLGIALPEPDRLATAAIALHARLFDLAQDHARVAALQCQAEAESDRLRELLQLVQGLDYLPPADLAEQNFNLARNIKAMATKLPGLQNKIVSLSRSIGTPDTTIPELKSAEDEYLKRLELRRSLYRQVDEFEGLPADVDRAGQLLERTRQELRIVREQRDAIFEGLVERETPRKPT